MVRMIKKDAFRIGKASFFIIKRLNIYENQNEEGEGLMKSQELTIYREIQRNTEMAMTAIDTISDKIYDDQLSMQVSRQAMKYSEIHNMALDQILQAKAEPYHSNHLTDMMLKTAIHYNTMLNTSTGHIAEMIIKGSNNGILEMNKVLNHNGEAGERSRALAKQLIDFEEKNIDRLKKYL